MSEHPTCAIHNCRNHAPAHDPFCAAHRDADRDHQLRATIRDLEAALAEAREANGKMAEAIDLVLGTTSKTIGGWEVCRLSDFTPVREALAHRLATKEKTDHDC